MRLKGLFWILTTLLLTILAVVTYYVFYTSSIRMFFAVEALVLLTIIYLFVFYRRIIKPLHIIGNGMELLKEQDFSSRLGKVGQTKAARWSLFLSTGSSGCSGFGGGFTMSSKSHT